MLWCMALEFIEIYFMQIPRLSRFKLKYRKACFTLCRKLISVVIVLFLCFVLLYFSVLLLALYV